MTTVQVEQGDGDLREVVALTEGLRSLLGNIIGDNLETHWFGHHLHLHHLLRSWLIDPASQGLRWLLIQCAHPH
jgi:hypothetical protein